MSPRPQIGHLRRPEILAAAGEVIRERGMERTRIADVADRVGNSAAAVLYYFESKGELLSSALAAAEERYYTEFEQQLAELGSPRERVMLAVESCLTEGDCDAALWMELWPRALRESELAETREELDSRWREIIARIVREGQEAGEFGPGDADDVAVLLACLLDGLSIQVTLDDRTVPVMRARRLAVELLERELECDLSPQREPEEASLI